MASTVAACLARMPAFRVVARSTLVVSRIRFVVAATAAYIVSGSKLWYATRSSVPSELNGPASARSAQSRRKAGVAPLSHIGRRWGSDTSSRVARYGPSGANVSALLPLTHCPPRSSWKLRSE